MECFNGNFLDPPSPLGLPYTPTPLHPYIPLPNIPSRNQSSSEAPL